MAPGLVLKHCRVAIVITGNSVMIIAVNIVVVIIRIVVLHTFIRLLREKKNRNA